MASMPEPHWAGRNPSPHDGGGGGAGGGGSPFTTPVEVAPADPHDPTPLLNVTAAPDYENVSDNGLMFSTRDAAGDVIFSTDVWGGVYVVAPPGMGPGVFTIRGADYAERAVEINSNSGVIIKSTGCMLSVESTARTSFVFRCTPDPDIPTLGFFGTTVVQQEAPTTLQDVIDVLTAYGLVKGVV